MVLFPVAVVFWHCVTLATDSYMVTTCATRSGCDSGTGTQESGRVRTPKPLARAPSFWQMSMCILTCGRFCFGFLLRTQTEWKETMDFDPALVRRFQPITVEEPTQAVAVEVC